MIPCDYFHAQKGFWDFELFSLRSLFFSRAGAEVRTCLAKGELGGLLYHTITTSSVEHRGREKRRRRRRRSIMQCIA